MTRGPTDVARRPSSRHTVSVGKTQFASLAAHRWLQSLSWTNCRGVKSTSQGLRPRYKVQMNKARQDLDVDLDLALDMMERERKRASEQKLSRGCTFFSGESTDEGKRGNHRK